VINTYCNFIVKVGLGKFYDFNKDIRQTVLVVLTLTLGVPKQSVVIFALNMMKFEIPCGEEYY